MQPLDGERIGNMTKKAKTPPPMAASDPRGSCAGVARVAVVRQWRIKGESGTRVVYGHGEGRRDNAPGLLAGERIVSDELVPVVQNRNGRWALLRKATLFFPWLATPPGVNT